MSPTGHAYSIDSISCASTNATNKESSVLVESNMSRAMLDSSPSSLLRETKSDSSTFEKLSKTSKHRPPFERLVPRSQSSPISVAEAAIKLHHSRLNKTCSEDLEKLLDQVTNIMTTLDPFVFPLGPPKDTEAPAATNLTDIALVLAFVQSIQDKNVDQVNRLTHPECDIQFGDMYMHITDFLQELSRLFRSFPNLKITWDTIHQVGKGRVELNGLCFAGAHTGTPYAFGGPYPEISAKGTRVVTDPETVILEVDDGQVTSIMFLPSGENSGLRGMYLMIGGFPM